MRLKPLLAHTNFWRGLSTEQLTRPSRLARTTADIAFAQAQALLGRYKAEANGVLLAVPAGYSREQLGLLLGVVNETGVPRGGAGRCSARRVQPRTGAGARAAPGSGAASGDADGARIRGRRSRRSEAQPLRDRAASRRARHAADAGCSSSPRAFVRKTRFDPLHDASTEQRLVDQLPTLARVSCSEQEHDQRRRCSSASGRWRSRSSARSSSPLPSRTTPSCCGWCRARASPACRSSCASRTAHRGVARPARATAARCAIARSRCCRAAPRRSGRSAVRSRDPARRRLARARLSAPDAARARRRVQCRRARSRRRRRCARRMCCSRAAPGAFPISRCVIGWSVDAQRARAGAAERLAGRVALALHASSGATARSWSRITVPTVPT